MCYCCRKLVILKSGADFKSCDLSEPIRCAKFRVKRADTRERMQESGCERADARERMRESGCERVDARERMRESGCERADARERMRESGCESGFSGADLKPCDLSEPIRFAKVRDNPLSHPLLRIRSCIRSHLSYDLSEPIRFAKVRENPLLHPLLHPLSL